MALGGHSLKVQLSGRIGCPAAVLADTQGECQQQPRRYLHW
jgi:hypothetical protein